MDQTDIIMPAEAVGAPPAVRTIALADLKDALAKGVDDFLSMPTHAVFLCLIYPIIGVVLGAASFDNNFLPLLYPLAAGFALIGPLAGIWMYELSRRRELGMDTSWRHAFDVIHSPSFPAIVGVGLVLFAIFGLWIASAQSIYTAYFGSRRIDSAWEFAHLVFTTPDGRTLILLGNAVGAAFAIVAAVLSVISFPLLLDRNVGFAVALSTSVNAVLRNPVTMAVWGLIVAAILLVASLPIFVGLAVAMPILGHATWHLYRKIIVPDASVRAAYQPPARGQRYAADFPASLFFPASRGEGPDR